MSNEAKAGPHTHNSSSHTIDLSLKQALEMDSQKMALPPVN